MVNVWKIATNPVKCQFMHASLGVKCQKLSSFEGCAFWCTYSQQWESPSLVYPPGRKLARTKQSRDDTCLKMVVRFKNCVAATDRVLCKRLLGNPQFETDMSQGSSHFLNHLIHSIQQAFFLVQNKIIPWTWNSWNFTITSISFRLNWIVFLNDLKGGNFPPFDWWKL